MLPSRFKFSLLFQRRDSFLNHRHRLCIDENFRGLKRNLTVPKIIKYRNFSKSIELTYLCGITTTGFFGFFIIHHSVPFSMDCKKRFLFSRRPGYNKSGINFNRYYITKKIWSPKSAVDWTLNFISKPESTCLWTHVKPP